MELNRTGLKKSCAVFRINKVFICRNDKIQKSLQFEIAGFFIHFFYLFQASHHIFGYHPSIKIFGGYVAQTNGFNF